MLGTSITGPASSPVSGSRWFWALTWALIAACTLMVVAACGGEGPSPTDLPTTVPATVPATQVVSTPTAAVDTGPPPDQPALRIGNASFPVELATTNEQRQQGLSDRDSLDAGTGMLFILEEERSIRFWMKDMRFPLDMLWFAADCNLVGINKNVPVPPAGTSQQELPRYGPGQEAKYVLEINAGESAAFGIEIGDVVAFTGSIAGKYGC